MIPCRSLLRVGRSYAISKRVEYLQNCCFYHGGLNYFLKMDVGKSLHTFKGRKKEKMVTQTWRAVSTQSSSFEEYVAKDIKIERHELGSQVEEVHGSISSHASIVQCKENEADIISEPIDLAEDTIEARDIQIESVIATDKHSISLDAGVSLMRFVKGKWGSTQKEIEEDMGVKLIFPSSRKEESIIIEGASVESVSRASEKIQKIIDEAVKSPNLDYSHFVSLPLAIHPELVDKLVNFQNSVLGTIEVSQDGNAADSDSGRDNSDQGDEAQNLNGAPRVRVELTAKDCNEHVKVDLSNIRPVSYSRKSSMSSGSNFKSPFLSELGIEKSIFIKPKTFHLTVLMLKLWNKDRVEAAAKVLQNVSSKIVEALDGRPIFIRLKGLECMRGSLATARVLYAPVEEIGGEGRLLHACQVIIDAFVEAGLVLERDAQQKLKLHATVMNARHRKRKKRTRKVDSFDARGIIDQFGSEDWGEYLIHEAHLSQRFVFDEDGYYHCCASIPFPKT